jgi:hypothetical protein
MKGPLTLDGVRAAIADKIMTKTTLVWSNVNKNRQEAGKLAAFAGFFAQPFTVDIGDTSSDPYPSYIKLDAQGKPKIGGFLYIVGSFILLRAVTAFCVIILLMIEDPSPEKKSSILLLFGMFIVTSITFYLFINKRILFRLIFSLLIVFDLVCSMYFSSDDMYDILIMIPICIAIICYLYKSKRVKYTFINK